MDPLGQSNSASHSPHDARCTNCSKLLAKHIAGTSHLEIKCVRCGSLNQIKKCIPHVVITDAQGNTLYDTVIQEAVEQAVTDKDGNTVCTIAITPL